MEANPTTPLLGELDDSAAARKIRPHHRMRGLFFQRIQQDLGEGAFLDLLPRLREPPLGDYRAFVNYPTHDYLVIFGAAARKVHPKSDGREAWRRYARDEIVGFSRTLFGSVTLSLIPDPTVALLRYPEVFTLLANGPTATAKALDERTVVVELTHADAPFEYAIGVLEGIVMSFHRHPRIEATESDSTKRFVVRWSL